MIVQLLLEDVLKRPLPELMQEAVLEPCKMPASTFEFPLAEPMWPFAATGHRADGQPISGRWHTYPEVGAGGSMWSTPSDMARFAIELMLAYEGKSDRVLSQETALQMLTPQPNGGGFGVYVGDDGGDRFYFFHDGANDGYKSVMVGYPKRGQGLIIMTNSDSGDALWREILNSVSVKYGWLQNYTNLVTAILIGLVLVGVSLLVWRQKRRKLLSFE